MFRKVVKNILFLFLLTCIFGCGEKKEFRPKEYMSLVVGNDLELEPEEHEESDCILKYLPRSYAYFRGVKEEDWDMDDLENYISDNGSYYEFEFRVPWIGGLTSKKIKDDGHLRKLEKGVEGNIFLRTDSSEYKPTFFYSERIYGLQPYKTFIVGFNSKNALTDCTFLYKSDSVTLSYELNEHNLTEPSITL